MEAVSIDELKAAKNFSTCNDLSSDVNESKDMKYLLDNFIVESNGRLQGEVWSTVSNQLTQFSKALETKMQLANRLSEAIQEALNILIDYMGNDYETLDCSKLPELEANKKRCLDKIASIKATISNLSKSENIGAEDNDHNINYYYGILNNYQAELNEIEKLINKLKGLQEKYTEAKKILDAAFAEVNKAGNEIANITVGKTVNFVAN